MVSRVVMNPTELQPGVLSFRPACAADVPAIVALVEGSYRGDASRAGWTTEADLLDGQRIDAEGVLQSINAVRSRVVLAFVGELLVGCAHIQRRADVGYFGMFSVLPTAQGGGIGRQILAECERQLAQDFAAPAVEMTVLKQRAELIDWYLRRGYVATGEHRPFPYGDSRFGLPRTDDLEFAVLAKRLTRKDGD